MMNNQNNLPVIVFDLGGVLMDWDPFYLYGKILGDDRQAVDHFLKTVDFYRWNIENDRGRSVAEGTAELSARFPEYSHLIRAYDERYLESLGGSIQPVVEIMRALKEEGCRLFCLSNWPAEKFAIVRPRYPFFEWFEGLVISGEVGLIKPDKAIFNLLLARIGRPAQDCLFIDDHESNISAAQGLGFQTILFQSPQQLNAELHRLGVLDGSGRSD